jgi:hypothetical protein
VVGSERVFRAAGRAHVPSSSMLRRSVRTRPGHPRASSKSHGPSLVCLIVTNALFRPGWLRILPDFAGLELQVVHTDDVARAYVSALMNDVRGPFNLAGDPTLNATSVAEALGIRAIKVPRALVRQVVSLTWKGATSSPRRPDGWTWARASSTPGR